MKDKMDDLIVAALKATKEEVQELKEKTYIEKDLKSDQVPDLAQEIQGLDFKTRLVLMDRYIYKTGPAALKSIFDIGSPGDDLLYVKAILAKKMGLEEGYLIGDQSLEAACLIDFNREKAQIDQILASTKAEKPSRKFQKKMKTLGLNPYRTMEKVLKRVAVFFLVFASIFGVFMATNSQAKDKLYSWIVEDFGLYSSFTAEKPVIDEETLKVDDLKINYIPEGYELVKTLKGEINIVYQYQNIDEDEDFFIVHFRKLLENSSASLFDTEDTELMEININGREVYFWQKKDISTVLWQQNSVECNVYGTISREEIIKIAENISK
ncbi:MAG: DUF4367 domain-containing protein [Bacillota bacterium]|nr:DUF4367 domain-containing protein [Bacillota bacterium]